MLTINSRLINHASLIELKQGPNKCMNQHVHKLGRNSCVVVITRCRAHHTPTVTERYWIVCMWNPDGAWSPGLSLIRMQLAVRRNAVSTLDGCQQQHTCAALWAGQDSDREPLAEQVPISFTFAGDDGGKKLNASRGGGGQGEVTAKKAGGGGRGGGAGGREAGMGGVSSVARSLGSGDVKLAWRAQLPRWPTHHHMTRRHKLANILAGVVRKARPTRVERGDWNAEFWVRVWVCVSVYVRLLGNSEFQVCQSCEMKCMCVCNDWNPSTIMSMKLLQNWVTCLHTLLTHEGCEDLFFILRVQSSKSMLTSKHPPLHFVFQLCVLGEKSHFLMSLCAIFTSLSPPPPPISGDAECLK